MNNARLTIGNRSSQLFGLAIEDAAECGQVPNRWWSGVE